MGLRSLLYVSKSAIPAAHAAREIESIVSVARMRNAELGVTGALIFTEARFAQVLEGTEAAIDHLMTSIRLDERHERITECWYEPLDQRRFPDWSMAYSGPSFYVDRHIRPLLAPMLERRAHREVCDRLLYLMEELTRVGA